MPVVPKGHRYLEVNELFQVLTTSAVILDCVSHGVKEQKFYVFDNRKNLERRSKKLVSQ